MTESLPRWTKHGKTGTRIYRIWASMITRCHNPKYHEFHFYGGRGIEVCARWRASFANFYADMGDAPEFHSLDRIDSSGHYELDNCRWANYYDQARNSRHARLDLHKATAIAKRVLAGELSRLVAADYGVSNNLPNEIVKGRCWPDALLIAKKEMGL